LEIALGLTSSTGSNEAKDFSNIHSRLDALASACKSSGIDEANSALKKCERLESEINPGSILSHQNLTSAVGKPLLYRRYEILSSQAFLQNGMEKLTQVQDLLQLFSDVTNEDDAAVYSNPSIISSEHYDFVLDPVAQQRLHDLAKVVKQLNARVDQLLSRVDAITSSYNSIIMAATEKAVLISEELSVFEGKEKQLC